MIQLCVANVELQVKDWVFWIFKQRTDFVQVSCLSFHSLCDRFRFLWGIQSQMMASVPMVVILHFCHEILYCTRLILHQHHALKVLEVWDQHHPVVKCNKNRYNFVCLSIFMVLVRIIRYTNTISWQFVTNYFTFLRIGGWITTISLMHFHTISFNFLQGWTFILASFLKMSSHCMDLYKKNWGNSYLLSWDQGLCKVQWEHMVQFCMPSIYNFIKNSYHFELLLQCSLNLHQIWLL